MQEQLHRRLSSSSKMYCQLTEDGHFNRTCPLNGEHSEFCPLPTPSFDLGLVLFVFHHLQKERQARSPSSSFTLLPFGGLMWQLQFLFSAEQIFYLFLVINHEDQERRHFLRAGSSLGIHCVCLITQGLSSGCQPPCLLPGCHLSDAKGPHLISLTKMSTALSYACVVQIRESHIKQSVSFTLGLLAYVFIFNSGKLCSLYWRWQSQSKSPARGGGGHHPVCCCVIFSRNFTINQKEWDILCSSR